MLQEVKAPVQELPQRHPSHMTDDELNARLTVAHLVDDLGADSLHACHSSVAHCQVRERAKTVLQCMQSKCNELVSEVRDFCRTSPL